MMEKHAKMDFREVITDRK